MTASGMRATTTTATIGLAALMTIANTNAGPALSIDPAVAIFIPFLLPF